MSAVCGNCVHCFSGAVDANLQRQHECRANPPAVTFVPTVQGVAKFTGYPTVADNFPACGIYEPLPNSQLRGIQLPP